MEACLSSPTMTRIHRKAEHTAPPHPRAGHVRPSIAVVIAARDAARHLDATLESIKAQRLLPDEIIVYDDGSRDHTFAVARRHSPALPMMTAIRGDSSMGISAARNRANGLVSSEYIAVLDADDLFEPDAILAYSDYLAQHPAADWVYADTRVVADNTPERGTARCYPAFNSAGGHIRRILGSPFVPFKHSSTVYRRSAVVEVGGYDESLPIKVDVDLFLRFLVQGRVVAKLDRVTSVHRKHRRQISTRRMEGIQAYWRLIARYEPDPVMRGVLGSLRTSAELLKLLLRG